MYATRLVTYQYTHTLPCFHAHIYPDGVDRNGIASFRVFVGHLKLRFVLHSI